MGQRRGNVGYFYGTSDIYHIQPPRHDDGDIGGDGNDGNSDGNGGFFHKTSDISTPPSTPHHDENDTMSS